MLKRILILLLCFGLLFSSTIPASAEESPDLHVVAAQAVLMDAESGRVLWVKDPHVRRPPASTTKIMTALLAFEKTDPDQLNQPVRISATAASTPESVIWLKEGETLTLEQLLLAALLASANDAAAAIAEQVGGSQAEFVKMMNARARELGLQDTHFVNPHGLNDPDHYSSAYDLAVMARHALTIPKFREMVRLNYAKIPWAENPWERELFNTNRLLRSYPGADGVKTGYTREAGNCLVASATQDGRQLIGVVLNSSNKYQDLPTMFDYGFTYFKQTPVLQSGEQVAVRPVKGAKQKEIPIVAAGGLNLPLREGEPGQLQRQITLPDELKAPLKAGQPVGRMTITLNGQTLGQVDLAVNQEVKRQGIFGCIWAILAQLWH